MEPPIRPINTTVKYKMKKPGRWRLHELVGWGEDALRRYLLEHIKKGAA